MERSQWWFGDLLRNSRRDGSRHTLNSGDYDWRRSERVSECIGSCIEIEKRQSQGPIVDRLKQVAYLLTRMDMAVSSSWA